MQNQNEVSTIIMPNLQMRKFNHEKLSNLMRITLKKCIEICRYDGRTHILILFFTAVNYLHTYLFICNLKREREKILLVFLICLFGFTLIRSFFKLKFFKGEVVSFKLTLAMYLYKDQVMSRCSCWPSTPSERSSECRSGMSKHVFWEKLAEQVFR